MKILSLKSPCDISSLPVEIFLKIFSYLPPVSQACLALACKGLYRYFSTVFKQIFWSSLGGLQREKGIMELMSTTREWTFLFDLRTADGHVALNVRSCIHMKNLFHTCQRIIQPEGHVVVKVPLWTYFLFWHYPYTVESNL